MPDPMLPIGSNRCKCAACGRYFGSVSGFRLHRVNFACVDPESKGLALNDRGYYVKPLASRSIYGPKNDE